MKIQWTAGKSHTILMLYPCSTPVVKNQTIPPLKKKSTPSYLGKPGTPPSGQCRQNLSSFLCVFSLIVKRLVLNISSSTFGMMFYISILISTI